MNKIVKRLTPALVIALLTGFLLPWLIMGQFSFGVSLGVGFAVWVILAMLIDTVRRAALRAPGLSGFRQLPLSHFGMLLGHLGLAATALGIVLVSSYSVTKTVSMVPGDSTTIGAYQFHFRDIRNLQGPNYTGATAQVIVSKKGSDFRQVLNAEKRFYPVRDMALSKVALAINPWRDLYVALGSPIATQQHAWSFRLYYKPFVRWIWGGGFLIILGSLLAVFDKRYRRRQETTVAKSELLQLVEEH